MKGQIKVALFDIGNTLGVVEGEELKLFPKSKAMLDGMRELALEIGVISNVPAEWDAKRVRKLLKKAGISEFFKSKGIITSTEAASSKPDPAIYRFAAAKFNVPTESCLFIGEDPKEVQGAIDAGMSAILRA